MNAACHDTVAQMLRALPPRERVVEFGSRNVNGSVRDLFSEASYIGVDLVAGPGVDVVADAADYTPGGPCDTVVCLSVLEHAPRAAEILANAERLLAPGGWLIVSAAGPDWPVHGADGNEVGDEHYQPVTELWLREQLGGFTRLKVCELGKLIYALAQKPDGERASSKRQGDLELQRTVPLRLNCGAGDFPLAYYVNLDSNPKVLADIHADATEYLLSVAEDTYAEIYAGHFVEHLTYTEAQAFLAAAYRALAPGGKLGIVVPDMREVLRRWLAGSGDAVEYPFGVWRDVADLDEICHLFLYSDVQETPHRWAWEGRTLARAMQRAGFRQLREIDRYRDPRLALGQWVQCGLDGYKPKEA